MTSTNSMLKNNADIYIQYTPYTTLYYTTIMENIHIQQCAANIARKSMMTHTLMVSFSYSIEVCPTNRQWSSISNYNFRKLCGMQNTS